MVDTIKKTALYEEHKKLNGNIVNYNNYYLPVFYTSIKEEHLAVRNNLGIFDVSHMGNFELTFPDKETAINFFNYLLPNDFSKIKPGKCIYSTMLYEHGGAVDDLIVMCLTECDYHIVVNCANKEKDYAWIKDQINNPAITLKNISDSLSIMAIQGPKALPFLHKEFGFKIEGIKTFRIIEENYKDTPILISSTGYTGEKGVEIIIDNDHAASLFEQIIEKGKAYDIKPCGLGARDTLRLEAAYPLYGHELDDSHSPLQANIAWSVKLNKKNDFIGKEAIIKEKDGKYQSTLVGFEVCGRAIPRDGMEIINEHDETVGRVTSGSYSPSLEKNIGLAYIQKDVLKNSNLKIKVRKRIVEITLIDLPFYSNKK